MKRQGRKNMATTMAMQYLACRLERYWKNIPCFCMTVRNLTMTLEEGRIRTWRLPAFSALFMALSASLRTEVLTILAVVNARFSNQGDRIMRYLYG
jgi:hypothetical protein